jgi:hypothetical protein
MEVRDSRVESGMVAVSVLPFTFHSPPFLRHTQPSTLLLRKIDLLEAEPILIQVAEQQ